MLNSYGDFHIWIAIILFIIGGVLLFSAEIRIENVGLVHLFCLLSAFFQAVQKIQHFKGTSFNTLSFTTSFQNYLFELNFSDKSISFLNKVKQMLRHLYLFNDFSKKNSFWDILICNKGNNLGQGGSIEVEFQRQQNWKKKNMIFRIEK